MHKTLSNDLKLLYVEFSWEFLRSKSKSNSTVCLFERLSNWLIIKCLECLKSVTSVCLRQTSIFWSRILCLLFTELRIQLVRLDYCYSLEKQEIDGEIYMINEINRFLLALHILESISENSVKISLESKRFV